jgi:hypothetical protein
MVYVVERYLPGLSRANLLPGLSKLESAIGGMQGEGSAVRYLGSTIVLGDEACFCQFEGPSEAAVAEANRRAGLPFDRIVPALLVDSTQRRGEMSVSTSIPKTARIGRSHRLVIVSTLAAVLAVVAWAIATYAVGSGSPAAHRAVATQAPALAVLTPQERQYVQGIVSLTPVQLRAAFGTDRPMGDSSGVASLTPRERRYVLGITALTPLQLWAAFGTSPTPPVTRGGSGSTTVPSATTSPSVALPILPACGPRACWKAAPSATPPARDVR